MSCKAGKLLKLTPTRKIVVQSMSLEPQKQNQPSSSKVYNRQTSERLSRADMYLFLATFCNWFALCFAAVISCFTQMHVHDL
eukprot:m.20970 g.20970  ORF g.20970 m.20970 type:complete len:82 (+) comp8232_c0_seq2:2921-3166(+)